MRYAARKDANHNPIEDALRRLLGDHVTDLSRAAGGVADLYISFGGETRPAFGVFVEIKRDAKADFTAAQIRFRKTHPGCMMRVETVDQAITLAQWVREQVKRLTELP